LEASEGRHISMSLVTPHLTAGLWEASIGRVVLQKSPAEKLDARFQKVKLSLSQTLSCLAVDRESDDDRVQGGIFAGSWKNHSRVRLDSSRPRADRVDNIRQKRSQSYQLLNDSSWRKADRRPSVAAASCRACHAATHGQPNARKQIAAGSIDAVERGHDISCTIGPLLRSKI
jgi:hypothetical protein